MAAVIDLSDVEVTDPEGSTHRLGDLVDRPAIVNMVRYYGCAPCRDQLVTLHRHADEIETAGGILIGIGPAAAYQARLLVERAGIDFPLLLDPHHEVARRVGMHRQSLARFVFDLQAWARWVRSFIRRGQGRIVGAYWETPAILVLDDRAQVRWSHLGRSIGDYPPIDRTLDALRRVAEEGSDPDRG